MASERWVPASSEGVAKSMRSNVSSGTKPELALRLALADAGIEPDGVNVRGLPGTPDFVWVDPPVAGFVHGCYWHRHGCVPRKPVGGPNAALWARKFEANVARRERDVAALSAAGFTVAEVWECECRADLTEAVAVFVSALGRGR